MSNTEYEWNEQQELILKKWAEIASCYQWIAIGLTEFTVKKHKIRITCYCYQIQ